MNSEDFNVLPLDKMTDLPNESVEEFSFDDLWDDRRVENPQPPATPPKANWFPQAQAQPLRAEIEALERQKQSLEAEISALKAEKERLIAEELGNIKAQIERMLEEGVKDLEQRKQALEVAIEQLERRRERIRQEMRSNFAGVSQELTVRVQGFKDYLVGSLQDLAEPLNSWNYPVLKPPKNPPAPEPPLRTERGGKPPSIPWQSRPG
jgi:DNA repair exonuclease SbcCD ATPase subunit